MLLKVTNVLQIQNLVFIVLKSIYLIEDFSMTTYSEKKKQALPAMKIDLLQRHYTIMKILGDLACNLKIRTVSGDRIVLNSKLIDILIKSIESNKGLLLVTGEIKVGEISWNDITNKLYDFIKNGFVLKKTWIFSESSISDREFCKRYLELVFLTEDNMQFDSPLTAKCIVKQKKDIDSTIPYLEISRYNYNREFGK